MRTDWNIKLQRMMDVSSDSMNQKYGPASIDSSSYDDNTITPARKSPHGYSVMISSSDGDVCNISQNSSYRRTKDIPLYCLCQKLLNIVSIESSDNTQEQYQALPVPEDVSDLDLESQVFSQDEDGDTLLHIAIIQQREYIALLFIELCSDPCLLDIQNNLFQTALLLAVLTQQTTIVKRLVEKGASLTYQDRRGDTALHAACSGKGNLTIVKALAKSVTFSQSLEIKNCEGIACLHLAARGGNLELLQFLLETNADANAKEIKTGKTVLHWAAESGNVGVLKCLFKCSDVDVNAVTYDSKTALELARGNGFADVVMDLLYEGANEKSDSDDNNESGSEEE
ncbi:hypothetical protein CHS0354_006026 [Potamilus streckersoni]|uniref:Uncharacterized protein n=1 Tax=Potamilus streckersoni TaxID=2493646 RepID=A0AAE0S3E3_9BIVA|nr:hypothetical protein CHS0354_006026 [Potamilus streckersoni]